jgi:hypothetical protein
VTRITAHVVDRPGGLNVNTDNIVISTLASGTTVTGRRREGYNTIEAIERAIQHEKMLAGAVIHPEGPPSKTRGGGAHMGEAGAKPDLPHTAHRGVHHAAIASRRNFRVSRVQVFTIVFWVVCGRCRRRLCPNR